VKVPQRKSFFALDCLIIVPFRLKIFNPNSVYSFLFFCGDEILLNFERFSISSSKDPMPQKKEMFS